MTQQTAARQILLVAVLLLGSTAAGFFAYQFFTPKSQITVDPAVLQNVVMKDPDGKDHLLTNWTGQPQIVNYWATWCAPCREEIPVLVDLQDQYAEQNLTIIGLSMDYPDDTEVVKKFMTQQSINYPILMAADYGNRLATFYGADNFVLPISIFINSDGTVKHIHTGLLSAEQAQTMVADIL